MAPEFAEAATVAEKDRVATHPVFSGLALEHSNCLLYAYIYITKTFLFGEGNGGDASRPSQYPVFQFKVLQGLDVARLVVRSLAGASVAVKVLVALHLRHPEYGRAEPGSARAAYAKVALADGARERGGMASQAVIACFTPTFT